MWLRFEFLIPCCCWAGPAGRGSIKSTGDVDQGSNNTHLKLRSVMKVVHDGLQHPHNYVRSAAIGVHVEVKAVVGDQNKVLQSELDSYIEDLRPAVLSMVRSRVEKEVARRAKEDTKGDLTAARQHEIAREYRQFVAARSQDSEHKSSTGSADSPKAAQAQAAAPPSTASSWSSATTVAAAPVSATQTNTATKPDAGAVVETNGGGAPNEPKELAVNVAPSTDAEDSKSHMSLKESATSGGNGGGAPDSPRSVSHLSVSAQSSRGRDRSHSGVRRAARQAMAARRLQFAFSPTAGDQNDEDTRVQHQTTLMWSL